MGCSDSEEEDGLAGYEGHEAVMEDAIPTASADMTRTLPIYFPDKDLMLKIEDYVPPMKEELNDSVLAIDTWNRETLLPPFFYKYFTETFMIPAYTCDTII